ncbi:MAG: RNA methyltransferase [Candidatus Cloacimonetes bacterium]|nr:RNA methyltransferase [Candidatus Cloacimonadota bacterium]
MIEKVSKESFKKLLKLNNKRYRDESLDRVDLLIEGSRLIEQVVGYDIQIKSLYFKEDYFSEHQKIFQEVHCPMYELSKSQSEALTATNNEQGIFAVVTFEKKAILNYNKLIYLNAIKDPGNLGSIIRTASVFDIDGIILDKNCCDVLNEKVVRASMGAVFAVPIEKVDESWIKNRPETIFVSHPDKNKGISLENFFFPDRAFIMIFGSEANGISEYINVLPHQKLFIEMSGKMQSLNVAIAAAIFMYKMRNNK